ncbi:MAG: hypothetical protein RBS01_02765 [Candidatus Dojkabacteria bacterium]|jgi:hypothetical protein|nr:hypothetical protein [Candidatus Dojkabacteria bacterium]
MAIEQIEPKLNSTEIFTNGAETPSSVENIPAVESVESNQSSLERGSGIDPLTNTLKKAELDGRIGYDSKEVKKKILSNISPYDADSWSTLMTNKVQGEEINSL